MTDFNPNDVGIANGNLFGFPISENEANIINDYDTAYYNYYKDETFIDTDTHNLGNKCY